MVKVLLFPIFDAQSVVSTDDEPVEVVAAGTSFLLATLNGLIILYEHGADCVPVHSFSAVNSTILSLQVLLLLLLLLLLMLLLLLLMLFVDCDEEEEEVG